MIYMRARMRRKRRLKWRNHRGRNGVKKMIDKDLQMWKDEENEG